LVNLSFIGIKSKILTRKNFLTLGINKHYNINMAGAGGIAEAAGLLLIEWSKVPPSLNIVNGTLSKAQEL
jgi:shikimate 5-dehydrogenase